MGKSGQGNVDELQHRPTLGWLTRDHHARYWLALATVVGGIYFFGYYSDDFFLDERVVVFGADVWLWIYAWGIYVSLAHFYIDAFLWKIRRPALRASL